MQTENKLVLPQRIKAFYTFGSIRKFLLMHEMNMFRSKKIILADRGDRLKKLPVYYEMMGAILNTRRFFFAGVDINDFPIVGIAPNFQKTNVNLEAKSELSELTESDFEDFYIYLFEDITLNLLSTNQKVMNKLVFLFDFEGGPINVALLRRLVDLHFYHYPGIVHKIILINVAITADNPSIEELGELVKSCPNNFFLVMASNYKKGILAYVKPDAFLHHLGGSRKYKNSYNFFNKEICFDF